MRQAIVGLCGLLCLLCLGSEAFAQLTPPYDWQVMDTEHFRIIFHPEVAGLAAEAAQAAEDAYARWAAELDTVPPAKTDIVIADVDDSPNGFADSDNLTSWAYASQVQFGVFFGGRVPSNMGDTVYHEYWHIADINHVGGPSETLRALFGRAILPNDVKPWFAIEGSATYAEDLVYGYSRASAALSRMVLQQLALDNDFPPLDRAAHSFSNAGWPSSGTLAYILGAWFVRYLEETHGRGTLAAIDHLQAGDWLASLSKVLNPLIAEQLGVSVYVGPDYGQTLQRATGVPPAQLYAGFQRWLLAQAEAQLARVQREGATLSLRLTGHGFWTSQPKWSPGGAWIAYEHSDPYRRGGLRLIRPDGTEDHALASATLIFDNAYGWSPDGTRIVYSNYDQRGPYVFVNDLYLYDLTQDSVRRLTWGERAFTPAFSPDGKSVYYAQNRGGDHAPRLMRLDLGSGASEVVFAFPDDTFVDFLSPSPDGSHLALSLWKRPGFSDLYLFNLGTHSLQALTQDPEEDYRPVWTPDGRYVLFDSIRDETFNLHAYRVADGVFFRVSNVVSGAFSPTVSPDGTQIAFVGYGRDGYDLHRMSLDPEVWTPVSFPPQAIPAWAGYPAPPAEARPYNAYETMWPKYWQPVLRESQAGFSTDAWDALYRQYVALEAGWDWAAGQPFGSLFALNQEHLAPVTVSALAAVVPGGDFESVSFSVQPASGLFLTHDLTLELQRFNFGGEGHALAGSWDYSQRFGKGLGWLDLDASLAATLTHVMDGNAWSLELDAQVQPSWRLPIVDERGPHELAARLSAGWSDQSESFTVGGVRGDFLVRGQPSGALWGSHAFAASLEYRTPVLAIERGWGLAPLFLDDVRVAAFADLGAAADTVGALPGVWVAGAGAELSLSWTTGYFPRRLLVLGAALGAGQGAPEFYLRFTQSF